ncbi:outer membrane protein assembly factor BamE [Celeribacter sp.]|uniref:outer membrane protein assembly factor BamE n=1 Tax=Celeribacter sp. TaxID=1890673 RepID=UPI003A930F98
MQIRTVPSTAPRALRVALALIAGIVLSACVSQARYHGYVPSDETLAEITVGEDTRESVAEIAGRPGTEGLLASSGWYYVRSEFRHLGAFAPKEVDRQVVAISFDDAGVVSNVERFGLEGGNVVALSRRVTTSNTRGITFLQQLFGNLGRLDTATLLQ